MALSDEMKRLINDMANAVINVYNIAIPIVDIKHEVKKIGGIVDEDPTIDRFSDGLICKTGSTEFRIVISPYQTEERKNFTIAHELGHLFLHMGFNTNKERWDSKDVSTYYRNGISKNEYQSNEFAAAFLMPQTEYKKIMDTFTVGNIVDTSKVAAYFHVSIDAAANRGKWLGYLKW